MPGPLARLAIVPTSVVEVLGIDPALALERARRPQQVAEAVGAAIARDAAEHGPTREGELRPIRCLGGAWFVFHAYPRVLPGAVNEQIVAMTADVVGRALGHVPDRPILLPAPWAGPPSDLPLDAED